MKMAFRMGSYICYLLAIWLFHFYRDYDAATQLLLYAIYLRIESK